MSSPAPIADSNQFSALSSPIDDGKTQEGGLRSRFGKDDMKEQAYQAREMIKTKAADLKEQIVNNHILENVQASLTQGVASLKAQVGLAPEASAADLKAAAAEKAEGEWEQVKGKGARKAKQTKAQVDAALEENLTPDQRAKLSKGLKQAKASGIRLERRAESWSNSLLESTLRGPALRPVRSFLQRNNLQLPAVLLGSLLTLWLGLTLIRLVTDVATPAVPEFDIRSKSATQEWMKYHSGEYKNRALDAKADITARASHFLSNHNYDALKSSAVDYRDIAINKLGLSEPTWSQWAWAKLTGRPITWQDRVESVLGLAHNGIRSIDAKTGGILAGIKHAIYPEATMTDKIKAQIPGMKPVGVVEGLKNSIVDGIDSIRSHLPGGESVEAAKQRAYDATHQSTLGKIQSGANYVKNRIVHGAEEAAHIVGDRANELADKAKLKAGL